MTGEVVNLPRAASRAGRPRAPAAVRKARGSRGSKHEAEPGSLADLPLPLDPPDHLRGAAADMWRDIARTQAALNRRGLAWIAEPDSYRLEIACYAYQAWRAAVRGLAAAQERAGDAAAARARSAAEADGKSRRAATAAARKAREAETGLMVRLTHDGPIGPNPWLAEELRQRRALELALRELGLTPRGRVIAAAVIQHGDGQTELKAGLLA